MPAGVRTENYMARKWLPLLSILQKICNHAVFKGVPCTPISHFEKSVDRRPHQRQLRATPWGGPTPVGKFTQPRKLHDKRLPVPAALQAALRGRRFGGLGPVRFVHCLTPAPPRPCTHTGAGPCFLRGVIRFSPPPTPPLPLFSAGSLFLVVLVVPFLTLKGILVALFLEVSALADVYGLPARLEKSAYSPESLLDGYGFMYLSFSVKYICIQTYMNKLEVSWALKNLLEGRSHVKSSYHNKNNKNIKCRIAKKKKKEKSARFPLRLPLGYLSDGRRR